MTASTPPDALPASKEAEASYQEIFNAIAAATKIEAGAISISVKDFRAALSTAIPAGDGVPAGMAKSALDCVVHALMVLPVPIDGQGKRAWASLLEAQTILEGLSTASTAGKG